MPLRDFASYVAELSANKVARISVPIDNANMKTDL